MRSETEKMQLRALYRWEFEIIEDGVWYTKIDNLEIHWSQKHQFGAYVIDHSLKFLHSWEELDELMQLTPVY